MSRRICGVGVHGELEFSGLYCGTIGPQSSPTPRKLQFRLDFRTDGHKEGLLCRFKAMIGCSEGVGKEGSWCEESFGAGMRGRQ